MPRWMLAIVILGVALTGGTVVARSMEAGLVVVAGDGLDAGALKAAYALPGRWRAVPVRAAQPERPAYDVKLAAGQRARVRARASGAEVTIEWTVSADTVTYAIASIGREDPTALCMGCSAAVSAPIPGAADGARLWLYRGTNGLSAPMIF